MRTYICGCVRNCEKYLQNVFENIRKIGSLFEEYKIIIVYDESADRSYNILLDLQKSFPLEIIPNRTPLSMTSRVVNISNARNSILEYMRTADDATYEYFIMMDMDDVCAGRCNTQVLQKYLYMQDKWDSLSFNRRFYYDIWALSIEPFFVSCWHWADDKRQFENPLVTQIMHQYITNKLRESNKLVDCISAFNGFAIYKKAAFIRSHYEPDVRTNLALMPPVWIEQSSRVLQRHIYTNWFEDCEHRHFHMKAVLENGAKIRIAPDILFE